MEPLDSTRSSSTSNAWPSRLLWFGLGVLLATIVWIWILDPKLFGLRPTVTNPIGPHETQLGVHVVDALSKSWDFDDETVSWDAVLPLAQISDAAYKQGIELNSLLSKFGLARISEFPAESMYGCVASNDDIVVVAFRGTNSNQLRDWLADADIASKAVDHGRVHSGFYDATQSLREPIFAAVKAHGGDNKRVWITGHSLGGAMALVLALDCISDGGIKPAGIVTFGQPLVVDGELAQFLNDQLKGKYLRFVHGGDIVPRVFPTFSHCGNLVWFVNDGYTFRRPDIIVRATRAPNENAPLEISESPPTMSVREFEQLQESLRTQREMAPIPDGEARSLNLRAPAFLEDHFMRGYLHWIVVLQDRALRTAKKPTP